MASNNKPAEKHLVTINGNLRHLTVSEISPQIGKSTVAIYQHLRAGRSAQYAIDCSRSQGGSSILPEGVECFGAWEKFCLTIS